MLILALRLMAFLGSTQLRKQKTNKTKLPKQNEFFSFFSLLFKVLNQCLKISTIKNNAQDLISILFILNYDDFITMDNQKERGSVLFDYGAGKGSRTPV